MSARSSLSDASPASDGLLAAIREVAGKQPFDQAIILGSGWGEALSDGRVLGTFPYHDWPCFPRGSVAGHPGRLDVVLWHGLRLLVFRGRWHCYQGLSAYAVTFPVRLAADLDTRHLLLTCATGGINPAMGTGDYMLVADHINLLGDNPLRGFDSGAFIDLCGLYRSDFYPRLVAATAPAGVILHRGVLAAMLGPSYETPAEISMLKQIGADVVGMSTVPEAIMARALGFEVAAVALISNPAAGLSSTPPDHIEVLACGNRQAGRSARLLEALVTHCMSP